MVKAGGSRDPEIEAIAQVNAALSGLEPGAQQRVIDYVSQKLGLVDVRHSRTDVFTDDDEVNQSIRSPIDSGQSKASDALDDISSVAKKWMKRNGLTSESLSALFSIGGDEIDLVAKKVPGQTKRDRMRSVLLLKGIAAYLASGAARITHEQAKEACLHYDAFDSANFSKYLRGMASEISGANKSGYTLTARGMAAATELIHQVIG